MRFNEHLINRALHAPCRISSFDPISNVTSAGSQFSSSCGTMRNNMKQPEHQFLCSYSRYSPKCPWSFQHVSINFSSQAFYQAPCRISSFDPISNVTSAGSQFSSSCGTMRNNMKQPEHQFLCSYSRYSPKCPWSFQHVSINFSSQAFYQAPCRISSFDPMSNVTSASSQFSSSCGKSLLIMPQCETT